MKTSGRYEGVVLDAIDPVKLAEAYGVEGIHVTDEDQVAPAIERGLDTVEREGRPLLLDISLPLGLPAGGHAAAPYRLARAGDQGSPA